MQKKSKPFWLHSLSGIHNFNGMRKVRERVRQRVWAKVLCCVVWIFSSFCIHWIGSSWLTLMFCYICMYTWRMWMWIVEKNVSVLFINQVSPSTNCITLYYIKYAPTTQCIMGYLYLVLSSSPSTSSSSSSHNQTHTCQIEFKIIVVVVAVACH